jgi:hypothetical protein
MRMKFLVGAERPRLGKAVLLTAMFVAVVALPAGATTPASFTLTAGALAISAPTGSISLGTQVVSNGSISLGGPLGVVTVSDQRGGATTWTASVISTAFTPIPAATAVAAVNLSYTAGAITASSAVVGTAVAVTTTNLTGVTPVVTGVSTGISTASWDPTITVLVPANFAPGVYSATITHSVA